MTEYIIQVEYDTLNGTFSQKKREEVVRCRDCKWSDTIKKHYACLNFYCVRVEPAGFCAWGERRDNGNS